MLAYYRCSDMISIMELNTQFDLDQEEAALLGQVYHAAKLNPEFQLAGMTGRALAISAVEALFGRGAPEADGYYLTEARTFFDEQVAKGTHRSLTNAVIIARDLLTFEELSEAWYAREDIEDLIRKDLGSDVADQSQASVAARYQSDEEFELALHMTSHGFEGTEASLGLFASVRFESALRHMALGGTKQGPELRGLLSIEELQAFGYNRNVRMAYRSVTSMAERIRKVSGTDALQSLSDILTETITQAAAEVAMLDVAGDSKLLAAELLPQLLADDPENDQYNRWRRKLRRHFKRAELTTMPWFSFNTYTPSEINIALQSLGVLTRNDTVAIIADRAVQSASIDDEL